MRKVQLAVRMVDILFSICPPNVLCQILVGLSRTTILFIVTSGTEPDPRSAPDSQCGPWFPLHDRRLHGLQRIKVVWRGSHRLLDGSPDRPSGSSHSQPDHRTGAVFPSLREGAPDALLLTFSFALVFGDLVKMVWGAEYRTVPMPEAFKGPIPFKNFPIPIYNFFLLVIGPLVAIGLWFLTNKTKMGKISTGCGR